MSHRTWLWSVLVLAGTVQAAGEVGVGLLGGTGGFGAQAAYRVSDELGLRVQAARWSTSRDEEIDGTDYKADLTLGAAGLLLDWHPTGGTFRVTGGVTKSLFDASFSNHTGSIEVGDRRYFLNEGSLTGAVSFGTAPYLGIGWGTPARKGLSFVADIGVQFLGSADVSLRDSSNTVSQSDIDKEIANAAGDFDNLIYPLVSLGMAYGW